MKGEPPWWEVAPPQEKKLESQVLLVHPASWRSAFRTRPANTGKNNIRFGKAGHYKRGCDFQGVPYRFVVSTQAINTLCVAEKIIFWKLQVHLEFWTSPRWFGGKKFTSKKGKTNLKICIVQVLEIIYIFSRNGFAESSRQELWPQIRSHNPLSSSACLDFPNPRPKKTTSIQPKHLCKDVSHYPQEQWVRSQLNSSYPNDVKVLFSPKARYENPFSFKPKTRQIRWDSPVAFKARLHFLVPVEFIWRKGFEHAFLVSLKRNECLSHPKRDFFFSPKVPPCEGWSTCRQKCHFFCTSHKTRETWNQARFTPF